MQFDAVRGAQAGLLQRAVFGQAATLTLRDHHHASARALLSLVRDLAARAQTAARDPERYNLVRVRMGGWTEFYSAMFPAHQEQHQRRQYFTP